MSAARYDLDLEAGASYAVTFEYKTAAGVAIDLTGYTAQAMIRQTATDEGTPLVDVAPAITPATGTVLLTLTPEQTRAALKGTAWALELTHAGGAPVIRLAGGRVKTSPEVVHD